jgi:hypothetical protein
MFFNFLLGKKNWKKMTKNEKENFSKCMKRTKSEERRCVPELSNPYK